jgi:hypothetical protein
VSVCLLVYLVYKIFESSKLHRVSAIGVLDHVEEFLGALNVWFIVHHASLGHNFVFVGLGVVDVVICHCQLNLTVCCAAVHC